MGHNSPSIKLQQGRNPPNIKLQPGRNSHSFMKMGHNSPNAVHFTIFWFLLNIFCDIQENCQDIPKKRN